MTDPIEDVEWIAVEELSSADYNPNHVATPELDLLATSIKEDGWTQPIVVRPDGTIVDGHHRYYVAIDHPDEIQKDGCVPVVTLINDNPDDLRIATIRHNRASGAHTVEGMAENINALLDSNDVSAAELSRRLGMEREEIRRLVDRRDLPSRHNDGDYEQEWKPQ